MTPVDAPPQYLTERMVNVAQQRGAASATSKPPGPHVVTIRLERPVADWLRPAVARISSLTALARGWDSYDGTPVEAGLAMQAVEFLLNVALFHVPPPAIVPLSDGGLQLEWHEGGVDLEISFSEFEPGSIWRIGTMVRRRSCPCAKPLASSKASHRALAPRDERARGHPGRRPALPSRSPGAGDLGRQRRAASPDERCVQRLRDVSQSRKHPRWDWSEREPGCEQSPAAPSRRSHGRVWPRRGGTSGSL